LVVLCALLCVFVIGGETEKYKALAKSSLQGKKETPAKKKKTTTNKQTNKKRQINKVKKLVKEQ